MPDRITKRAIDTLKPGETIWDGELKGYGCRAATSGAKSYVVKYRHMGRQRWLTIGRHGSPWTPDSARRKALDVLARVSNGEDPAGEKALTAKGETVAAFAARYREEYAERHKKPSSLEADHYHLKNHILPSLGRTRMDAVTERDVAKLHSSLHDRPYTANRVLALLGHMYAVAAKWGVVAKGTDPTADVEWYKEYKRERFLSADELARLSQTLTTAEAEGENPYVIAALRLLILTGARLNEILKLQWSWVDVEGRALRLPDSKTGAKVIHLNAPAVAVLSDIPRHAGNPHVICGAKVGAHMVNLQKPWRRIRALAGLDDVRIHDLRHSFASVAVSGGMSLPMIGALLGHSQPQTTQRYAHLAADPLKAASDRVASEIGALMAGGGADIVPLPANKKG